MSAPLRNANNKDSLNEDLIVALSSNIYKWPAEGREDDVAMLIRKKAPSWPTEYALTSRPVSKPCSRHQHARGA